MKRKLLFLMVILFSANLAFSTDVLTEGFETWPPTGWTLASATSDDWVQDDGTDYGPGSAYAGSYAAMYNNYDISSGNAGSMITPSFDVSALVNPEVAFYWWNNDGSYNPATIEVLSSTDGTNFTTIETIDVYGSGATTWVLYSHSIGTDVTHIKLIATSDYGSKNTFVDSFVVSGQAAGSPGLPTNPSPADAATDIAVSGNLTWTFGSDTDTYDLWFGEAGSMAQVVTGGTAGATGSYTYSAPAYSTGYEWQVIAHNAAKSTTNGPTWSFTTFDGKATNPTPADEATGILVSAKAFNWDDVGGADSYIINIGTATGLSDLVDDAAGACSTSDFTYTGANWDYGEDYFWTVKTVYTSKATIVGDEWSFTTEYPSGYLFESFENTFPPTGWQIQNVVGNDWTQYTTSSSPDGGKLARLYYTSSTGAQSRLVTPVLNISTSNNFIDFYARYYSAGTLKIQYSTDATTWTDLETVTITTSFAKYRVDISSLAAKGNYYLGFLGETGTSYSYMYLDAVNYPELASVPPGAPTNPNPDDDATNVSTTQDLTWTNGLSTSTVDVYFSSTEALVTNKDASVKVVDNVDVETYDPGTMSYSTEYFWRVVCKNAQGDTDGSVWSFTTAPEGLVQIGDGTETGKGLPIEPYYGYDYNQTIYLSSDFSGIGTDKRIEKLYYHYTKTSTGDTDEDNWKIWIGTTASTNLDGGYIDVSTLTEVFDGSTGFGALAAGEGWIEITLTTPFIYNPAADGNIVTAVHEYSPSYTSNSDEFYCDQDTRANVSRTYHNDSNNPDPTSPPSGTASAFYPNTRFQFEDVPGNPTFAVSPESKDFGTINVDESSSDQTFTISNTGGGTLQITSVGLTGTDTDQFTLTDGNTYPHDLAAGASITVDVAFAPTTEGAKTANLNIVDNLSKTSHDVALSGVGYDPTLTPPFTEDFSTWYPADWSKAQGILEAPVTFTSTTTCLWASDGFANVGTSGAAKCNVYGTSRKEWMITPPINLGAKANYQLEFDLALTDYGNTDPPASIGEDDKYAVIISTDNGATWTSANALQIWDNTTTPSYGDISTTGQHITIDLTSYSGKVKIGFYAESTVNNADNDLFVDNVEVKEIPTTPVFAINPESKDFGTVNIDESSSAQTFTISNTGVGTLTIDNGGITITGTDSDQFALTDNNQYPINLGANESATVDVTFSPTAAGSKTANLHIVDNLSKSTHDAALSGICYDPTLTPPFTEDFSSYLPTDWSEAAGLLAAPVSFTSTTSSYWTADGFANIGTTGAAKCNVYSTNRKEWMITPPINLGTSANYQLEFDLALTDYGNTDPPSSVGSDDKYAVIISTDNGVTWTSANALQIWDNTTTPSFADISTTGQHITIDLSSYTGKVKIGFYAESTVSNADNDLFVDNVTVQSIPAASVWAGTTDNNWNIAGNWNNGIPGTTTNVTIPAGLSNYPTISTSGAKCNNLTIQSTASGDGSLIENGNLTASGTVTVQRYISNGQWHGVSAPVSGATAQSLYSTTANVYLKEHSESTNTYTNITALTDPLGDGKGFMMWYAGASGETFDITGDLRGSSNVSIALTRGAAGASNGWNFVGNPYTSAIDWDAGTGWTKTNVGATVYLYNAGSWATWNGTLGTGGMTDGYIAMGQGFFVEVNDDGSTTGTLTMTNDVQAHNSVGFLKSPSVISELVRLEVNNGTYTDETVIYFEAEATAGYDSQFDAHKLFSFNPDRPQIYSTANNFMAINALPIEKVEVAVDVIGVDDETMTITATEVIGFGDVFMLDNYTGIQTNLTHNKYEFLYDEDITNRFLLFFSTVSTPDNSDELFTIYSHDNNVRVIIPVETSAEVVIYNLVGQKMSHTTAHKGINNIPVYETGYYLVKVMDNNTIVTKKIFIK